MDLDVSRALIARCKQEKAKLNGTVSAAMLLSVAQELEKPENRDLKISCQSYVDLRSQTTPRTKDEYLGLMTSAVSSFHKIKTNEANIWDVSKDIDQQIQDSIN